MKTLALFLVSLVFLSPGLRADQAAKILKIEEMFEITHVDQLQLQMLDQFKSMMTGQLAQAGLPKVQSAEVERRLLAMIADRMSWEKMKPDYIKAYDETFTEEELTGILDFYKSQVGKALIEKTPSLVSKTMALRQQAMAGMMPEMKKMVDDLSKKGN